MFGCSLCQGKPSGRPRKSPVEGEIKRPRGRLRKQSLDANSVGEKGKRGRPRKNPLEVGIKRPSRKPRKRPLVAVDTQEPSLVLEGEESQSQEGVCSGVGSRRGLHKPPCVIVSISIVDTSS